MAKQIFEWVECFGIEAKNKYLISVPSPDGQPGQAFMYAHENSDCCERVNCKACRSLTMNVHSGANSLGPILLSMHKTFHCPMPPWPAAILLCPFSLCCLFAASGPEFTVRDTPDGPVIGSVFDPPGPLFCCKADSIIRDEMGSEIMRVGPVHLCQVGMCCPCCADQAVPVTRDGQQVATITRNALTCAELCGKINRFTIDFGSITDVVEKKLIFAAAMLFDLQYWEQNKDD